MNRRQFLMRVAGLAAVGAAAAVVLEKKASAASPFPEDPDSWFLLDGDAGVVKYDPLRPGAWKTYYDARGAVTGIEYIPPEDLYDIGHNEWMT